MFGKKKTIEERKRDIDDNLEIYRRTKMLEINANIQERKENNWLGLDKVRQECRKEETKLLAEIAKLEAKKEELAATAQVKDDTIALLQETIRALSGAKAPKAKK